MLLNKLVDYLHEVLRIVTSKSKRMNSVRLVPIKIGYY